MFLDKFDQKSKKKLNTFKSILEKTHFIEVMKKVHKVKKIIDINLKIDVLIEMECLREFLSVWLDFAYETS